MSIINTDDWMDDRENKSSEKLLCDVCGGYGFYYMNHDYSPCSDCEDGLTLEEMYDTQTIFTEDTMDKIVRDDPLDNFLKDHKRLKEEEDDIDEDEDDDDGNYKAWSIILLS